jgi:hypothetical protein
MSEIEPKKRTNLDASACLKCFLGCGRRLANFETGVHCIEIADLASKSRISTVARDSISAKELNHSQKVQLALKGLTATRKIRVFPKNSYCNSWNTGEKRSRRKRRPQKGYPFFDILFRDPFIVASVGEKLEPSWPHIFSCDAR